MRKKEQIILGSKVIEGGTYDEMNVMGELRVTSDIAVDDLNIMGEAVFTGNLTAKTVDILGQAETKNIKAEEINIAGILNAYGNVEATSFNSLGIVKITGDLNVDNAQIHISPSKFNNIYGDKIEFVKAKKNINITNNAKNISEINEIEATTIRVTNCKIKKISGEDVAVYENCEIETLEYSKRLSIAKDAKINKIIKF